MTRLLVDMLALELKTVLSVKAASDSIFLKYVQIQVVPQACSMVHQCATDTASLIIRMDKDRPNFVADQRDEAGHIIVNLKYPRLCF